MENFLIFLIYLTNFIVYESFYFYLTRSYYCKKNMGKCDNCKCWSCRRPYYLKKAEREDLDKLYYSDLDKNSKN